MTTDSEPSRATERWEEPRSGEETEPETRLQAAGDAELLSLTARPEEEPPVTVSGPVNLFRGGAKAKASLKWANWSGAW